MTERKRSNKKVMIIIISAAAAILIAAAFVFAWLKGAFLPSWIHWEEKICENASEDFRIVLSGRKALLYSGTDVIWENGDGISVQDILLCDIDHDGEEEIMVLCWKIGKYSKVVPRTEKEEQRWFQHVYIYKYEDGRMNPVWMASETGIEIAEWKFNENDRLVITDPAGNLSRWDWIDWGLEFIE